MQYLIIGNFENLLETDRFGSIFWKECLDYDNCKETDRFGSKYEKECLDLGHSKNRLIWINKLKLMFRFGSL